MGIRYIFGRAGIGKSHRVLQEIKKKLEENPESRLILIVPEQFTLQAERDLIEKLRLPGIMDVNVLSFTRLAYHVFNEVGGLTRIHINEQGKNMILRKIIGQVEKDLTIYKKACQQEGFIAMFNELLCELKQHDVLPEDLVKQLEELEEDSILYHKLQDIALIYSGFDHYLQGRYIDMEDAINLLIEKIEQAQFLKNAYIWIDGFTHFTPQTYRIIEKLLITAKQVTMTFNMEFTNTSRDKDLFKPVEYTYDKIHEIAMTYSLRGEIIDLNKELENVPDKAEELKHLERELYAQPYVPFENIVENVQIFSALNLHMELEYAAAQIICLVRDQGYRWKDIALVCNDMENYQTIIKRVFEEYEIPYFMDQKRTIMHNPIVETVLSVLSMVYKGYKYEDVFRFFKAGFSGLEIEAYEKLENYAIQYGIQGNKWTEPFVFGEENLLKELNSYREKFIEPMKRLEKIIKRNTSVGDITRALYDYLEQIHLPRQLEAWIDILRKQEAYEYVNENTQIWNIIMEIFDQLVEMIGEQKINLREYIRILQSGFASIELGIIPTTIDQVLVGNIQRSKSHDIKALFVVGVNDGVLPPGKQGEGMLSEEERSILKEKAIELSTDREKQSQQEKLMIYSAFTKPSKFLWLSYSLADQEGKALRPSILVDRIKKIFPKINIQSELIHNSKQQHQLISTPKSTFKYLVENIRKKVDGKELDPVWWEVYKWYSQHEHWDKQREAVIEGLFHENQVTYIESSFAKKLYNVPIRSSVSRLEQFVNCPFAHFVKYGLKPKERLEYKIQAPDIGDIFHKSLEAFHRELSMEKLDWHTLEREKANAMMDKVIDEVIHGHGNGVMHSTHRYKYLVKRLKRIGRRAVWTLTEHIKKGGFKPMGYEVAFGLKQMIPPIEIELADGEKLYLEGRIDRVDILEEEDCSYIKVMDYKSGNKEFSISDVYHGLQLQLMIYLDAMLNNKEKLKKKELRPAGVLYFKIDDPMIKTEEKLVEVIEQEVRKKFKMKGLVLKDVNIVKQIDRDIQGHSEIIPVALKKDGEFYNDSSALSQEEFTALLTHVRKLVQEISNEMLKGNIRIEPLKNGKLLACTYCGYATICQFDSMFEDNHYKSIRKLTDQEVLEKIMKKEGGVEDGHVD